MMTENLELKVQNVVSTFERPFNLADVIIRCQKSDINNKEVILGTMDELVDRGLINYRQIEEGVWGYIRR